MKNVFEEMIEYAKQNNVPIIKQEALNFILEFLQLNHVDSILEIGTAIGFSGSVFMKATGAKLTTIEKNVERSIVAKQNFAKLGLEPTLIVADAAVALERLVNLEKKYDFIFLDGPKGQYLNYMPHILKLLNHNGILIADNIYFMGMVGKDEVAPKKHRTIINNLNSFINYIKTHKNLKTKFYDIDDGISVSIFVSELKEWDNVTK